MPNLVDAINLYLERHQRNHRDEQYGEIVSVSVGTAQVRIRGSNQLQEATLGPGVEAESSDFCVLTPNRTAPRPRWRVSQIIGNRSTGAMTTRRPYPEIFPPTGVRTFPGIIGGVLLMWDAPVTAANIQFQVQSSPDMSAIAGMLTVGGSYAIIENVSSIYLRVRSIAPDGQTSAWSAWIQAAPGTGGSEPTGTPVTYCGLPLWYEGEQLFYEEGA